MALSRCGQSSLFMSKQAMGLEKSAPVGKSRPRRACYMLVHIPLGRRDFRWRCCGGLIALCGEVEGRVITYAMLLYEFCRVMCVIPLARVGCLVMLPFWPDTAGLGFSPERSFTEPARLVDLSSCFSSCWCFLQTY
jgi:hypothetical protein